MKRSILHEALSKICTVRQLSNRESIITERTIILMKKPAMASVNNRKGIFEYWEVLCYVPAYSMVDLDELQMEAIDKLLPLGVEITGSLGADFYDPELEAYMTSVEIRVPKTLG